MSDGSFAEVKPVKGFDWAKALGWARTGVALVALCCLLGVAVYSWPKGEEATAVTIKVPAKPIVAGDMVVLEVDGISATSASLSEAVLIVSPSSGVQTVPGVGWKKGGKPFITFWTSRAGIYDATLILPSGRGGIIASQTTITVQNKGPGPEPGPGPDPGPSPTPTKLRVLFSFKDVDLKPEQRNIVYTGGPGSVRDYCDRHCLIEVKGDVSYPAWRLWKLDGDGDNVESAFQPLLSAAGNKPSIIIQQANGDITTHDMPATPSATLQLLEKYGGK